MHTHVRAAVQPLLDAQHGLVTLAQLRAAGVDRRLPRRHGWTELAPEVWCAADGAPSPAQQVEAARLYAGEDAIVSGSLACRVAGLRDVPERDVVDVLVRHGTRLRGGRRLVVHQTLQLPRTRSPGGVRVAEPVRAVADAARWCDDLRSVRALVLAAVSDGRVDAAALEREHRRGQRHGRAHLARALADGDLGARSAPEAEAADAVARVTVLPFVLNARLVLDGRFLGLPDGYLPGHGLGWEVDSVRHHGSSTDLADTLARHQDFADAGVELVHVVPAVLRRDPAGWARSLVGRATGRRDPAGLRVLRADGAVVG